MSADRKTYALQILSGKQQGGLYPLPLEEAIVIGRSAGVDLVLAEDMISRRHAKITVTGDEVVLEDLGSTNGTFVNGERITKVQIGEGDRILVGATILTMTTSGEEMLLPSSPETFTAANVMSGRLEEIALPDLLQLFRTSQKTGTLHLQDREKTARVHLRGGRIVYAHLGQSPDLPPAKAIHRILTWEKGAFELRAEEEKTFPEELGETTEALLMESMRQIDELRALAPPEETATLALSQAPPPLRELSPDELDLLQIALEHRTMGRILDVGQGSDLEIATKIRALLDRGYLEVRDDGA